MLVSDRAGKGRHLAASIASGIYWRLEEHCFKQEIQADGLSVFFLYSDEFSADGVSSLLPHLLSVEPGSSPHRFRLNDKLYMKLVTPQCEPLYTVDMNLEG